MDNAGILKVILAVVTLGIAAVVGLFWRLWSTLATKADLIEAERRIVENDVIQDERTALRFTNEMQMARIEVLRMHTENQSGIKRIEDILLSRKAFVHND